MNFSNKALDCLSGKKPATPTADSNRRNKRSSISEQNSKAASWNEYETLEAEKMFDCFPARSSLYQGRSSNTFITKTQIIFSPRE